MAFVLGRTMVIIILGSFHLDIGYPIGSGTGMCNCVSISLHLYLFMSQKSEHVFAYCLFLGFLGCLSGFN